MNILKKDFDTIEEGMKKLKEGVAIRNSMGGALYWNILNDDCYEIADKLRGMGAEEDALLDILKG